MGLVLTVGVRGAWRGAGGRCLSALFGDPFSAGPRGRVRRTQSTQCARCWAIRAGGAGWPRLGGGRAAGVRARVRVCGCGACGGMSGWLCGAFGQIWLDISGKTHFGVGGAGWPPAGLVVLACAAASRARCVVTPCVGGSLVWWGGLCCWGCVAWGFAFGAGCPGVDARVGVGVCVGLGCVRVFCGLGCGLAVCSRAK